MNHVYIRRAGEREFSLIENVYRVEFAMVGKTITHAVLYSYDGTRKRVFDFDLLKEDIAVVEIFEDLGGD